MNFKNIKPNQDLVQFGIKLKKKNFIEFFLKKLNHSSRFSRPLI